MGPGTTLTNNSNTLEVTARVRRFGQSPRGSPSHKQKKKKKKSRVQKLSSIETNKKCLFGHVAFKIKVTVGGAARQPLQLSTPFLLGRVGDILTDSPPQFGAWVGLAMFRATHFSDAPQRGGARGIGSGFVNSWVLHEGWCNSSA